MAKKYADTGWLFAYRQRRARHHWSVELTLRDEERMDKLADENPELEEDELLAILAEQDGEDWEDRHAPERNFNRRI